jgi:hypothetical protein
MKSTHLLPRRAAAVTQSMNGNFTLVSRPPPA